MAKIIGTMDISTLRATRFATVLEYGEDRILATVQADLAIHNAQVREMFGQFAEATTDRARRYGGSSDGEMYEVDEYGRVPTQWTAGGSSCGFPMKLYQFGIGWTRKWMQTHKPADLAEALINGEKAHIRAIRKAMKTAIFTNANYTFNDFLVDKVDIPVVCFCNADSAEIPTGPNGESFDGATHQHFTANAGLVAANVTALVTLVAEHGHTSALKLFISATNETAFRALAGFTAYPDPRLTYRASDTATKTVDIYNTGNRAIGIFDKAEVWVKPWAIANYIFCCDLGGANKPLCYRQRESTALQGLRLAGEIDSFPLRAQYLEDEYGFGVWNRTNGAVHYFGGGAYVIPTIT